MRQTVSALQRNIGAEATSVYVFLDGARAGDQAQAAAVAEVRNYAQTIDGFGAVELIAAEQNLGLGQSIIRGVSHVIDLHERVIVLEDDIVTAPSTLDYFRFMLDHYQDEPTVFSISAYSHPPSLMPLPADYAWEVYFIRRMMCWGWATWADRWRQADWEMRDFETFKNSPAQVSNYVEQIGADSLRTLERCVAGELDVWACRWVYAHFKHQALCACPAQSLVNNIGLDGSGANSGREPQFYNELSGETKSTWKTPQRPGVDQTIAARFAAVYSPGKSSGGRPLQRVVDTLARPLVRLSEWLTSRLTSPPTAALKRLGTPYGGWRIVDGVIGANDVVTFRWRGRRYFV